jgi:hypothetical protein
MPTPTSFDPSSLPNLKGFIVLITGGHSGLYASSSPISRENYFFINKSLKSNSGLATTQALASKNATVYIASRSIPKAESAIKELEQEIPNAKVAVIEMDLSDLESVKRGAEEFVRSIKLKSDNVQTQADKLDEQERERTPHLDQQCRGKYFVSK